MAEAKKENQQSQQKGQAQPSKEDMDRLLAERCNLWINRPVKTGVELTTQEMKEALELGGVDASLIRKWMGHLRAGFKVALTPQADKYSTRDQQYIWHIAFWCSRSPNHCVVTPDGSLVSVKDAQPGDIAIPKMRFATYIEKASKGDFDLRAVAEPEESVIDTSVLPDERQQAADNASDNLTDKLVFAGKQTYEVMKTNIADPVGERIVDGLLVAVGNSVREKLNGRLDNLKPEEGGLLGAAGLDMAELAATVSNAFDPAVFLDVYEHAGGKPA